MTTYTFTLIAEGPDLQTDELADALFEAGCDDPLVGCADSIQYIDFDREAETVADAVLSAVADVETVDGVHIVRLADAGLVSMADIAARTGRTRESIRLLISGERGPGGFLPPSPTPAAATASGAQAKSTSGSTTSSAPRSTTPTTPTSVRPSTQASNSAATEHTCPTTPRPNSVPSSVSSNPSARVVCSLFP